jgi:hypothetical protein
MSFDVDMMKAHLSASNEDDDQSSQMGEDIDEEDPDDSGEAEQADEENPWFRPHPKFPGKR